MATAPHLQPRLFTAEEYHGLVAAGLLGEHDRVELVTGEIVQMTPIGNRHAITLARLISAFLSLADAVIFWTQNPIRFDQYSELQPDFCLLRPPATAYDGAHAGPSDVLLLVEVSDTSIIFDTRVKLPLYSAFAVPEVWIVDLTEGRLQVHRDPSPRGYLASLSFGPGDTIAPEAFPNLAVDVGRLLGQANRSDSDA